MNVHKYVRKCLYPFPLVALFRIDIPLWARIYKQRNKEEIISETYPENACYSSFFIINLFICIRSM